MGWVGVCMGGGAMFVNFIYNFNTVRKNKAKQFIRKKCFRTILVPSYCYVPTPGILPQECHALQCQHTHRVLAIALEHKLCRNSICSMINLILILLKFVVCSSHDTLFFSKTGHISYTYVYALNSLSLNERCNRHLCFIRL